MTNADNLRMRIEEQRIESGFYDQTKEQREENARIILNEFAAIKKQNKGLDLMGTYKEIRKGYHRD